jgi:hypothetical protein
MFIQYDIDSSYNVCPCFLIFVLFRLRISKLIKYLLGSEIKVSIHVLICNHVTYGESWFQKNISIFFREKHQIYLLSLDQNSV